MSIAALIAEAEAAGCRLERRERDDRTILWGYRPDLLLGNLRDRIEAHRDEVLAHLADMEDGEHLPAAPPLPDPSTAARARVDAEQERAVTGLLMASHAHVCRTCGAWACFGFGPPGGAPAAWFCPSHREEGELLRRTVGKTQLGTNRTERK